LVFACLFLTASSARATTNEYPTIEDYLKSLDYNYQVKDGRDYRDDINIYAEDEKGYSSYSDPMLIDEFHSIYTIEKDATVKIDERIWVYFQSLRHGIYRFIPTIYPGDYGFYYDLKLKLDSVLDENNDPWAIANFEESDPFMLQIGSADDSLLNGELFRIKYSTERGIRYFDDYDEFYWNVSGADWEGPILNAKADVILPEAIDQNKIKAVCYLGKEATQEANCSYKFLNDRVIEFTANRKYNSNSEREDFTIAVAFPKGVVAEPGIIKKTGWLLAANWGITFLPPIMLIALFVLWYLIGRDRYKDKAIIAQYTDVPALSPLIAGNLLFDRQMKVEDISAEIIYLAEKKYFKIVSEEVTNQTTKATFTKHKFVKTDKPTDDLKDFQKKIIYAIFKQEKETSLNSLSENFYVYLDDIKRYLKIECLKFYRIGSWITVLGIILACVWGLVWAIVAAVMWRWDLLVGGILTAVMIGVCANYLPRKSDLGDEIMWHLEGMKEFIKVAERDRLKFYEKEKMFEEVLPYAMVFNMIEQWEKAFEEIYKGRFDWYESKQPLKLPEFGDVLRKFAVSTAAVAVSRPQISTSASSSGPSSFSSRGSGSSSSSSFTSGSSGSSGGGRVGGGFGGGGGGSW
jgi:uncharacterized membrane protein YgcG